MHYAYIIKIYLSKERTLHNREDDWIEFAFNFPDMKKQVP